MSEWSQVLTTSPSLRTTLGPVYIGTIVAVMQVNLVFLHTPFTDGSSPWSLFRITNLQVLTYYMKYPKDWWAQRYLVVIVSPEFNFAHWSSIKRLGYCGASKSNLAYKGQLPNSQQSCHLSGFLMHFMLLWLCMRYIIISFTCLETTLG